MEENCNKVSADFASSSQNSSLTEWKDMDLYHKLPIRYQESGILCDAPLSDSYEDPGAPPLIDFSDNGNVGLLTFEDLSSSNDKNQLETANQIEENIYSVPILCASSPLKHSLSESTCLDIKSMQNTNLDYNYNGRDFYHASRESLPLLDNDVVASIQSENVYETLKIKSKEPSNPTQEKFNVNLRRRIFKTKKQNKKWNFFRRSDPFNVTTSLTEEGENKKQTIKFPTQKSVPIASQATIGSNDLVCDDDLYSSTNQHFSQESDVSWPSDEFDCSDNLSSDSEDDEYPNKPLPPIPKKQPYRFPDSEVALNLFNKIRSSTGTKNFSDTEEESLCLPVTLKTEISPHLPPPPEGLTRKQVKRRCVLECIISSEKSYIESLQRIHQDYETPIMEAVDSQKSKVKGSLKKLREILNYHRMFQIELANRVNNWQEENIIGDIFIASFSKSMVLDAYSVYVNNFTATMEDIKKLQRTRQSFRDFLKQKEASSQDRLSIFALMVKPIQRFPQFIMCLQDLLKYTPKGHEDRKALQLAVTILENLALKLNDRKRESEKKFAAKQLSMKMRIPSFLNSFLIREDDVFHIVNNCTKKRRLIMLNDALVCIKVQESERDGEIIERYKLKWTIPLQYIRLKSSCSMPLKMNPLYIPTKEQADTTDKSVKNICEEIFAMSHDYNIWSQIHNLASSLKLTYEILNEKLINGILSDLQRQIQVQNEQLQLVNNCTIELEIPEKSGKVCEVFQTLTPTMKQHWCLDLAIAKLALSPQNQPGWDVPVLNTDQLTESLSAFHVNSLAIDVSTHMSQLQCAVGVYLQSFTGFHIRIPHIWVCSNIAEGGGQVSIVSVQTGCSSIYLNEAFQATDSAITCVESVAGDSNLEDGTTSIDTVWMATETCKMYIYGLQICKSKQRQPIKVFDLPGKVLHLLYAGDKIFAGMDNGYVLIFERKTDRDWCIEEPQVIKLSSSPIVSLLEITNDDCILAASDNMIYKIDYATGKIQDSCCLSPEDVILDIVQAGVGIWVSYRNSPTIHLYHIENLNLLQDINISSAGTRVLPTDSLKECTVTCLLVSLGMLWIGTNIGLLLSFPLPRLRNGVPIVSGRPYVSYHGHKETVRFLMPFMLGYRTKSSLNASQNNSKYLSKGRTLLKTANASTCIKDVIGDDNGVKIENNDDDDDDDDNQTLVKENYETFQMELKAKLSNRYNSTPNLLIAEEEEEEEEEESKNAFANPWNKRQGGTNEMEVLYGSLMCNSIRRARTQSLYRHRLSKRRGNNDGGGRHVVMDGNYSSTINNRNAVGATKGNSFTFSSLTRRSMISSANRRRSRDEAKCQNVSAGDESAVSTAFTTTDSTITTTTTTTTETSTKKKATLVRQDTAEEISEEDQIPKLNDDNLETTSTTATNANTITTTTPTSPSSSSSSSSSSSLSSSSTRPTTTTTTTPSRTTPIPTPFSTATNHFSSLQSQMSQSSRIWEFQEESDCNSIMIVSGGNGYLNASPNAETNKTSKGNDATLLFWIYKI